ncbi:MAG: IS91 family transposase [bacterium]|nr:IS91 family transposase [bacterium]
MTNQSNKTVQKTGLKKRFEVADVVFDFAKKHQEKYGATSSQKRILENILHCRTIGMGGHVNQCDHCRNIEISYNSCRNRHCPKCQSLYKERWLEDRRADLLPMKYLHSVFTLPHELNDLILYNKKVLLNALFAAVKHALNLFSKDPEYGLIGQLGFTSVLHTWDQKMNLHYHLHCILPAGVYSQEEVTWISAKYKFLFPVKAVSKVFRGKYVSLLRSAYNKGKLNFPGKIAPLGDPSMFSALLSSVMAKDWVVFTKQPFKSPDFVLDYLGRYTHRVAISNNRIVEISDQRVLFTYRKRNFKSKRYACKTEICDLKGEAFISRFLLHELPSGFMRIRHFGFMGNNCKKNKLQQIRFVIGAEPTPLKPFKKRSTAQLMFDVTGIDITLCSKCKKGKLKKIDEFDGIYQKYPFHQRGRPR